MSDELPDIREAPDGWTIASVRGVVDRLQYGISTKADAVAGTGTPILRMGNIQDGRLDISDLKFVPRSKALDDVLVARGDILFNRTNSPELVGKSAVIDTDDEAGFLAQPTTHHSGDELPLVARSMSVFKLSAGSQEHARATSWKLRPAVAPTAPVK